MHPTQYLIVSLACFAAMLLAWLMESTVERALNALT
jgi:hypothetical protein